MWTGRTTARKGGRGFEVPMIEMGEVRRVDVSCLASPISDVLQPSSTL